MSYLPASNKERAFPIGGVVAIHPEIELDKIINDNYWKPCNGTCGLTVKYPNGSYYCGACNNFDIDNLNDDVFLMGSSESTVDTGGSNVILDHQHCTSGSNLMADGQTFSGNSPSVGNNSVVHTHTADMPNVAFNTESRGHCHTQKVTANTGGAEGRDWTTDRNSYGYSQGWTSINNNLSHCHYLNYSLSYSGYANLHCHYLSVNHTNEPSDVNGTIGTSTSTDVHLETIEHKPKYLNVMFFMRIK